MMKRELKYKNMTGAIVLIIWIAAQQIDLLDIWLHPKLAIGTPQRYLPTKGYKSAFLGAEGAETKPSLEQISNRFWQNCDELKSVKNPTIRHYPTAKGYINSSRAPY